MGHKTLIDYALLSTSQDREAHVRVTPGTPQGGVISPLLANLFLHYAFDRWMAENHPSIPFERYADDIVVHCRSEAQAQFIRRELEKRLAACRLELHPEKTQVVYCRDSNRPRLWIAVELCTRNAQILG